MTGAAASQLTELPIRRLRSIRVHLMAMIATAVMLGLAFPRPGWWPLAFVALVPMGILVCRSVRPARLMWTSFVVLFAWWLIRVNWLIPVTVGGYIGVSAFEAAYQTVAILLLYLLSRRYRRGMMVLALPLVWVSMELLRGNWPSGGFNWFLLGYSLAPYDPEQSAGRLIQLADVLGVHGVSFLVAMTNGLFVDLLTHPLLKPGLHGRRQLRRSIRAALTLWLICLVGSWVYGQYRIGQWEQVPGEPGVTESGVFVAVLQTNVSQSNKDHTSAQQIEADWQAMLELTGKAGALSPKVDLIVWPETMVPGPINREIRNMSDPDDPQGLWQCKLYHRRIAALARAMATNLLVGAVAYDSLIEVSMPDWQSGYPRFLPGERTNSVLFYDQNGRQAPQRYDKIHLVPFGEYLPWIDSVPLLKRLFLKTFSPYESDYSLKRGTTYTVFDMDISRTDSTNTRGAIRVATPICYEDVSPGVVRKLVYGSAKTKRVDLLANLTNSAWFGGRSQRLQHLQIAVFRSIENRVPMVRSVNTGISGFIDSVGRVGPLIDVGGRRQRVAGIVTSQVRFDSRTTWYGQLGRIPATCLALLALAVVLGGLLRRGKMSARY